MTPVPGAPHHPATVSEYAALALIALLGVPLIAASEARTWLACRQTVRAAERITRDAVGPRALRGGWR